MPAAIFARGPSTHCTSPCELQK